MKIAHLLFEGTVTPDLLDKFLRHCSTELGLESLPKINLIDDKKYSINIIPLAVIVQMENQLHYQ